MQRLLRNSRQIRLWVGLGMIIGVGLMLFPGCTCWYPCLSQGMIDCPTALERDYGRSVNNNKVAQILNPTAGFDERPMVGLAPQVGVNTTERYEKTFKRDETPPPINQMVTTFGGGGGAK